MICLFFKNKWEKQVHPLSWLVEKFWPVKGWTDKDLKKLKEDDKNLKTTTEHTDTKPFIPVQSASSPGKELELSEFKFDSEKEEKSDKKPDTKKPESPPKSIQKVSEWYQGNSQMHLSGNTIQVSEGKRLIFLDVASRPKEKAADTKIISGLAFGIEPSKGIIYYADEEVNLKIFIKKQD